jgi:drug/metabolite transporter (DMT)-like permease
MTRRGWALFGVMCVVWGIPYLLIRVAVRDVSPATLVLARTALAAALLLPLAAVRGEVRPALSRWAPLLAFAVVEIAVPWYLLGTAEEHLSSSLTALLIAAIPLVATVIARTTGDRERVDARGLLGLGLGVVGVAAIVGLSLEGASVTSVVEVAGVVLCYATGPVILQRTLADQPALGVIALSLAATAVAYVPMAAFSLPSDLPSAEASASIAALAILCTAFAFLVFFALIAEVGPRRAMVFTYVNPAVAAIAGVVVLDEAFTAGMGVGFVLVLLGSLLATRPARDAARAAVADLEPSRFASPLRSRGESPQRRVGML